MESLVREELIVTGYRISKLAEPIHIIENQDIIEKSLLQNGFSDVSIKEINDYDAPQHGIVLGLELPFLDSPLQLQIIEWLDNEDVGDITFQLNTKENGLTYYQSRWLLMYIMQVILDGEADDINLYLNKMLQNVPIEEEDIRWN